MGVDHSNVQCANQIGNRLQLHAMRFYRMLIEFTILPTECLTNVGKN